jgi:cell division protein FtsB
MQEKSTMKRKFLRFFKNKYTLSLTIFLLWICFFNNIDLFYVIESRVELYRIQKDVKDLEKKNEELKIALEDLSNNSASLEKFARETYYMKRDNEEVFVFKERGE